MNLHTSEIRQALAEGKKIWGGHRMIDEESFYIATVKLRKNIATLTRSPRHADQIAASLDAIENLIENAKGRLMGRAVIRPADFEPHLQVLEAALAALPPFREPPSSTASAEFTIETARLEAARIIEEAHREADEIRRRAHQPRWSIGDEKAPRS